MIYSHITHGENISIKEIRFYKAVMQAAWDGSETWQATMKCKFGLY